MEELAIMNSKNLNTMDKSYKQIAKNYMGHISELVSKNIELENLIKIREANSETAKANRETLEANHTIELQKMQMQINKMEETMREQELLNKNKLREQELLNKIHILEHTKNQNKNDENIVASVIAKENNSVKKTKTKQIKTIDIKDIVDVEEEDVEVEDDERTNDQKIYDEFIAKHLIKKKDSRMKTSFIAERFIQWKNTNKKEMTARTDRSITRGLNKRMGLTYEYRTSVRTEAYSNATTGFVDVKYVDRPKR